ncbi:MAG: type II toxin-antitoxin system RelE/ParE family toxin [Sphingomonas sp.]|nr:type II toxin-antitoxin system RelE/ParE family toxin [Sphingomonas sp.]
MRIEFANDDLVRICCDDAHRLGLPFAVIKAARRRLVQLEAAKDERDLRNLKSLHYKKMQGGKEGLRSVRVNDQYRIEFTISEGERPPVITITAIADTH